MKSAAQMLQVWIEPFLSSLWVERGSSQNTLVAYRGDLLRFAEWLAVEKPDLQQVDRACIEAHVAWRQSHGLSARSTARFLSCARSFFGFLQREAFLPVNPVESLRGPKLAAGLPKSVTESDVERLLLAPDIETPAGLRDRAMLEILYAAGLRVSELVGLTLQSINLRQGVVRVRGKGGKERLVPLGEEAIVWLERYLAGGRAELLTGRLCDELFPSNRGQLMTRQLFWHRIKHWAKVADLRADLSPHSLRHAFATHLLNHGADIRVLQLLLGHSNLSTTQIYTQVAKQRLKSLHQEHHPRG